MDRDRLPDLCKFYLCSDHSNHIGVEFSLYSSYFPLHIPGTWQDRLLKVFIMYYVLYEDFGRTFCLLPNVCCIFVSTASHYILACFPLRPLWPFGKFFILRTWRYWADIYYCQATDWDWDWGWEMGNGKVPPIPGDSSIISGTTTTSLHITTYTGW